MTTTTSWTHLWFWWLLFVFVSWITFEGAALVYAHWMGQKNIQEWTLSDTIRRWSTKYRWLGPLAAGLTAMLFYHFFIEQNLSG